MTGVRYNRVDLCSKFSVGTEILVHYNRVRFSSQLLLSNQMLENPLKATFNVQLFVKMRLLLQNVRQSRNVFQCSTSFHPHHEMIEMSMKIVRQMSIKAFLSNDVARERIKFERSNLKIVGQREDRRLPQVAFSPRRSLPTNRKTESRCEIWEDR